MLQSVCYSKARNSNLFSIKVQLSCIKFPGDNCRNLKKFLIAVFQAQDDDSFLSFYLPSDCVFGNYLTSYQIVNSDDDTKKIIKLFSFSNDEIEKFYDFLCKKEKKIANKNDFTVDDVNWIFDQMVEFFEDKLKKFTFN